jgi:hypothetical protein
VIRTSFEDNHYDNIHKCNAMQCTNENPFLSARKADLKKGFQHLVVLVVLVVVLVVGTRVKNAFRLLKGIQCEILNCL